MSSEAVTVVGGGLVGLSIAREFALHGSRVTVIEKEKQLAAHQSGRNSGVIHAGPYYKPGSLKAKLCVEGNKSMVDYAERHGLPHRVSGKVIVATNSVQRQRIADIYERAIANGVEVEMLERSRIGEIEPNCPASHGIFVKRTGVISYAAVANSMAAEIRSMGGSILLGSEVLEIRNEGRGVRVVHSTGDQRSDIFFNAAGLQSDRVAKMAGLAPKVAILPFLGQYFELPKERQHLVNGLIYPAPDPELPFLGVHVTKSIDGTVHAGPNAVLTLAREGYMSGRMNFRDAFETVFHPGLGKFLWRFKVHALDEILRSSSKERFAKAISNLISGVSASELNEGPSGIRAQAVDWRGKLVDDFVIQREGNQIHILNAPSPAATAALSIAEHIRKRIANGG